MQEAEAPNMIQAAIFDMDGLLIDSEPFWEEAEVQIFSSLGLPFTRDMCAQTIGMPIDEVVRIRHREFGWNAELHPLAEVTSRILDIVVDLVKSQGAPMPGVPYIIKQCLQNGYRVALASSSPYLLIDATLARLGIAPLFEVVQSAEKLPFGKPHPQVFLECAQKLGIAPESCVVFEDSLNGVIAAKAANMLCIQVLPNAHSNKADCADIVLSSLTEFDFTCLV